MKKNVKKQIIIGILFFILFVLYTVSLTLIDRQPIGPGGSIVGYATVNGMFRSFVGVNMTLYHITDWLGLVVILLIIPFALKGLAQLISRRSLSKVDGDILLLGAYYVCTCCFYILFEVLVINHRPVLINGFLEASYPSSTTMLAMSIIPSVIVQMERIISNRAIRTIAVIVCVCLKSFMVIGRLFSGVHWLTDIVGGALLSASFFIIYHALHTQLVSKDRKKSKSISKSL